MADFFSSRGASAPLFATCDGRATVTCSPKAATSGTTGGRSRDLPYAINVTAEQRAHIADVISGDPEIMHGMPCFTGIRVPVQTLMDYIEEGDTLGDFLRDFPVVNRNQAVRFLELVKDQLIECVS